MVLEILCVEPIYPQYSGVLKTCLALRYWFFEVLGSESVKRKAFPVLKVKFHHTINLMKCLFEPNYVYTTITRQQEEKLSNSYTMGCPPVRGDNPRALASGLSYV